MLLCRPAVRPNRVSGNLPSTLHSGVKIENTDNTNEVCFLEKVAFKDQHPQTPSAFLHLLQFQVLHTSHRLSSGHSDLMPLASESITPLDPGAKVEVRRGVRDNSEPPCGFWEQNLGFLQEQTTELPRSC